jgi:hypothetical protein
MISDTVQPRSSLAMPIQVAPVDRAVVASALNSDGSVNPSWDLSGFLKNMIPIAAQLATTL